jgi:hypothetical protein
VLAAPASGAASPTTGQRLDTANGAVTTTAHTRARPAKDPVSTPTNGPSASTPTSALIVFAPVSERRFSRLPGVSVGIMSASQGLYTQSQLLLDIGQGSRVAASAYDRPAPPPIYVKASGSGGIVAVAGWRAARKRAEEAPQLLLPGLLAAQIEGGAGYVGYVGRLGGGRATTRDGRRGGTEGRGVVGGQPDALVAADRSGHIAAFSDGSRATLLARIAAMRATKRLVVTDLPAGPAGRSDLMALARARSPRELLIVVQRRSRSSSGQLLWTGIAGLPGGGSSNGGLPGASPPTGDRRELTSQSTNERGLIVSVDLAPTILDWLGLAVPADMRGEPIGADGRLDSGGLRKLRARLYAIGPRRLPALGWLLAALALVLVTCAPWTRARVRALRVCGLAVLWAPVAALASAAFDLGAATEYATIAVLCVALGALTDLLVPWPRAPIAPAIGAVVALTADALAGTQLAMRSLLGPDPLLGARFYGIGNELKSGLAVLVFAAVAAWCYPCGDRGSAGEKRRGAGTADGASTDDPDTATATDTDTDTDTGTDTGTGSTASAARRRAAAAMAGAGITLAIVEGSARIGAGVGGVILVSAGTAVAVVVLLPGELTRRRGFSVLLAPVAGLALLAALDLALTKGSGHFTGSVLDARSAGDLRDLIVRRYEAAWKELGNGAMPVATALALLAAAVGVLRRERLLAPVAGDPGWLAALGGGLTAGVVGALVEDSGPVLLVVAVFALVCVLGYVWGVPAEAPGRVEEYGTKNLRRRQDQPDHRLHTAN